MFKPGKRHMPGRAARWLTYLLFPGAMAAAGCGFWDDFRAQDYSIQAYLKKEDPVQVLTESADGNKRARALAQIKEPIHHGGSEKDQDYVVLLLTKAAREDPQAWCRLQAIRTLGTFKDPRAVDALIGSDQDVRGAYYLADNFPVESRSVLRIQCMNALAQIGDQRAVDLLVNVLKAPPIEASKSSEAEKQMNLDERLAAADALSNFKTSRATEALVQVLRNEKDTGLRDVAAESLQKATGKKLPPDAQVWEDALYSDQPRVADNDPSRARIMPPILRTSVTEKQPK